MSIVCARRTDQRLKRDFPCTREHLSGATLADETKVFGLLRVNLLAIKRK